MEAPTGPVINLSKGDVTMRDLPCVPDQFKDIDLSELQQSFLMPAVFISVGTSQIGKSTFLNLMLGRQIAEIGIGLSSVTSRPTKYVKETEHGQVIFIDTPGVLDSKGVEVDRKNEAEITAFLDDPSNVPPKSPVVILVFLKYTDSVTGPAKQSILLTKKIANHFSTRSKVVVVQTFAESIDLPARWVQEKEVEFDLCPEDDIDLEMWRMWGEEKMKLVAQDLGSFYDPQLCILSDQSAKAQRELRAGRTVLLRDNSDMCASIAKVFQLSSSKALRLMATEGAMGARKAATDSWLKVIRNATVSYALVNGVLVGVQTAVVASELGVGAAVGYGVAGVAVGVASGALVAVIPVAIGTGIAYLLYTAINGNATASSQ